MTVPGHDLVKLDRVVFKAPCVCGDIVWWSQPAGSSPTPPPTLHCPCQGDEQ